MNQFLRVLVWKTLKSFELWENEKLVQAPIFKGQAMMRWRNFERFYRPRADAWTVYDNSGEQPAPVESGP